MLAHPDPTGTARALMDRFADATGLTSDAEPRRYLWTDAFAVCNWLGLGETERAAELVDRVHESLGRHRHDDPRDGWISGLDETEGARRPTAAGLRIGKPMPERAPDAPYDPRLEWERDGQYFHYLTRWIRALDRMADSTGSGRYARYAVELSRVAYERFSHGIGPIPNQLYWKMSIDLSRPLIASMGQHDALDGYVVMSGLRARMPEPRLDEPLHALAGMARGDGWWTDDPLGAGALLADAWFLARLPHGDDPERTRILGDVLHAAERSLKEVHDTAILDLPASQRLPFRELGLAIGLAAAERMVDAGLPADPPPPATADTVASIGSAVSLRESLTEFWLREENQRAPTWVEHEDISTVMLATSLAPDGYLGAESPKAGQRSSGPPSTASPDADA